MSNEEKHVAVGEDLKRVLKPRHITMISLGGALGTGIFIATGASLSSVGPGGAIIAYTVLGIMVFFLMQSLGEMSTYLPVAGSFETYATRFIDPALGFAMGWNYWFNWAITVACELAAGALVMQFWFPDSPAIVWSVLFAAILFILNALSAKGYGESEYWFAMIKVIAVIVFLIVGLLMIFGVLGGHAYGLRNFTIGDAPFVGGMMAFVNVAIIAGFSFQGTELLGIASGETEDPEHSIPRATKTIFYRIMLFNVGSVIIMCFLIAYNDPNLLGGSVSNMAQSPYTMVFEKAGIPAAVFIMNFVILTGILSAGNSGLYASTRILYGMAISGKAPKIFSTVTKKGVPMAALIFTTIIGFISFLSSLFGSGTVYMWLVNASSLAGFFTWWGIALCHWRFRKAYVAQGKDLNDLKFKAKWYPFGPIFAFIICTLVILCQNIGAFTSPEGINWIGVAVSYIGVPLVLICYVAYKIVNKTKLVKLEDCDFSKGIASK